MTWISIFFYQTILRYIKCQCIDKWKQNSGHHHRTAHIINTATVLCIWFEFSWCLPTDGAHNSWKVKIYHVSPINCGCGGTRKVWMIYTKPIVKPYLWFSFLQLFSTRLVDIQTVTRLTYFDKIGYFFLKKWKGKKCTQQEAFWMIIVCLFNEAVCNLKICMYISTYKKKSRQNCTTKLECILTSFLVSLCIVFWHIFAYIFYSAVVGSTHNM